MSEKIDRVLEKLDKIDERVDRIDVTLAKQEVVLEEHVRRTDLLEGTIQAHEDKIEKELAPIRKHINLVKAVGIIIGGIGGLLGFLATLKALLE